MKQAMLLNGKSLQSDLRDYFISNAASEVLLVLLSGGSQIEIIDEIFQGLVVEPVLDPIWSNLIFTVNDERWNIDSHHDNSNFQQLIKLQSVQSVVRKGAKFMEVLEKDKRLQDTGQSFARKLQGFAGKKLSLLGLGDDGHIAGILPHSEDQAALFNSGLVASYDASRLGITDQRGLPYRITVTYEFLGSCELWLITKEERLSRLSRGDFQGAPIDRIQDQIQKAYSF